MNQLWQICFLVDLHLEIDNGERLKTKLYDKRDDLVVSNTYCVVFFFYLYSSWVPYTASFSGLSIFDYSSVFFDVYLE